MLPGIANIGAWGNLVPQLVTPRGKIPPGYGVFCRVWILKKRRLVKQLRSALPSERIDAARQLADVGHVSMHPDAEGVPGCAKVRRRQHPNRSYREVASRALRHLIEAHRSAEALSLIRSALASESGAGALATRLALCYE